MDISTSFLRTPSFKSFFSNVLGKNHHEKRNKAEHVEEVIRVMSTSLPKTENEADAESEMIKRIAVYVQSILRADDDQEEKQSCFHLPHVPEITIDDYLHRIVKYVNKWGKDTPSPKSTGVRCALMAIEYLDRNEIRVTPKSVHHLLLIAVLLSVKNTEDFYISSKFWSDVGGCTIDEVNEMELAFCNMLNWKFEVSRENYMVQESRFG